MGNARYSYLSLFLSGCVISSPISIGNYSPSSIHSLSPTVLRVGAVVSGGRSALPGESENGGTSGGPVALHVPRAEQTAGKRTPRVVQQKKRADGRESGLQPGKGQRQENVEPEKGSKTSSRQRSGKRRRNRSTDPKQHSSGKRRSKKRHESQPQRDPTKREVRHDKEENDAATRDGHGQGDTPVPGCERGAADCTNVEEEKLSETPILPGLPLQKNLTHTLPPHRYDFEQYNIDLALYREMKEKARAYASDADVAEFDAMSPAKLSWFRRMWECVMVFFAGFSPPPGEQR
ncbi:hypothetical protein BESB_078840 [Besnoitia besnoiti]|uniref:Uncharacterized protein n=1 Tax=Besnoitia besnoiti TaxID=94643 RepID=A0A2A9M596_BESBE|nr:hypothetical protein BESB_078840 [Besnoitia besnoiti]PFH33668.1 hypothetical protein BESB_078840 [Besnoitia besnoiti]